MVSKFELDKERLGTSDEFGHRIFLHPEDVKGVWRRRRDIFFWILIFVFLIVPWIYVDGQQLILFDIIKREFNVFGSTYYASDTPIVVFMLAISAIGIAFVTSIWGRVWCGWACPQTVFIDALYRRVERLVEGKSLARQKLDSAPMSFMKFFKKSLKWSLFTLISLHIAHSFVGYFVGTRHLLEVSTQKPAEHWELFVTVMFLTGLFLFDFGWFREQFCIIACPYGRMQSVMMDDNSLIVAYDDARGEPRKNKDVPKDQQGDCVNCYACVRACPTGIDIRRGTQLECIACTNCIDACDDIMTKLKKPKGLIRYSTENKLKGISSSRVRPYIYLTLLLGIFIAGALNVRRGQDISFDLLRTRSLFSEIDYNHVPGVLNHRIFAIHYRSDDQPSIEFKLQDDFQGKLVFVTPKNPFILDQGHHRLNFFFRFDRTLLNDGKKYIKLDILRDGKLIKSHEVKLVGPLK